MRSQTVEGVTDTRAIDEVGLSVAQVEEMYRYLAIANYEDRFVIPTSQREMAGDAFAERNGCGFTFGDGCHGSDSKFNLFNSSRIDAINITEVRDVSMPSTSPKCATKRRANNADPQSDRPVDGVSGLAVVGMQ